MIAASSSASRATLHEAPNRLLRFLDGVADPAIGGVLAGAGLTGADVDQAYALFDVLRRHTRVAQAPRDSLAEGAAECVRWQRVGLVRLRAVWSLEHPEEAKEIFHGLLPGDDLSAVVNAKIFLERWGRRTHPMMNSEAVAALRESVKGAVGLLAPSEARSFEEEAERRRGREDTKRRMHAWVTAWTAVARTTITRRDHLIRLGIASRRGA